LKLYSIASGSSGNCICVGHGDTHVLIDVGISKKRVEEGLTDKDINPKDIGGILITHEHSDHISGLGVLSRKYNIPIYGTQETMDYVRFQCSNISGGKGSLGVIDPELFHEIEPDKSFDIGQLQINPFNIHHDAVHPVGYRIEADDKKVAVATDMGHFDDYIIGNLLDLDAILIEANHDIRMLETGPYPYPLKRRILGDKGHLCNEMCGRLLDKILNDKMKMIALGHLSKENNYPYLAYESVRSEINLSDSPFKADDFNMEVAKRECPSSYFEF